MKCKIEKLHVKGKRNEYVLNSYISVAWWAGPLRVRVAILYSPLPLSMFSLFNTFRRRVLGGGPAHFCLSCDYLMDDDDDNP